MGMFAYKSNEWRHLWGVGQRFNAGIRLWENMCGMVRKVLLLLWDSEDLMQIRYDNDWPGMNSRGGI